MSQTKETPSPAPAIGDRSALLDFIDADAALRALLDDVSGRLDDDPGHDLSHALRVALWTVRLGGEAVDPRAAIAAALLHDVVNLPKDSPDRAEASLRSAALASELLPRHDFSPDAIALIADAIRDHSYSRGVVPKTPLGKALQDADRLEALGALGVFRTISCGTRMGARYFHADDPWAEHRALDDRAFTVDHFFKKLLLVGETMQTEAGRAEAARRTTFLRAFLDQLAMELGQRSRPHARPRS
jgi:uncharacterized protein